VNTQAIFLIALFFGVPFLVNFGAASIGGAGRNIVFGLSILATVWWLILNLGLSKVSSGIDFGSVLGAALPLVGCLAGFGLRTYWPS
jgi:hypothetical protein